MPVFRDGDAIKYRGKIYRKFERKIDLYNPARCGGTFILQVLDCIFFPESSALHSHLRFNIQDGGYMVIPYRDFRDKFASHWRAELYNRAEKSDWDAYFNGTLEEVNEKEV